MADEKFLVTKEGLDELLKEQDNLIHVVRDEVIRELQEARAQGDLSENADKKAATKKTVSLGSTVTILDMSTNEEETYNIVGSIEADPLNGKLSNITPLATSLMDHKIGDVVEIETAEEPYQVKVIDLK